VTLTTPILGTVCHRQAGTYYGKPNQNQTKPPNLKCL